MTQPNPSSSRQRYLVSYTQGRARLRHPALRSPELSGQLCLLFRSVPGVTDAVSNPRTGSLLLTWDNALVAGPELLEKAGLALEALPAPEKRTSFYPRGKHHARQRHGVTSGMLVSLTGSVAFALAGSTKAHVLTGGIFLVLNAMHLYRYRHRLLSQA